MKKTYLWYNPKTEHMGIRTKREWVIGRLASGQALEVQALGGWVLVELTRAKDTNFFGSFEGWYLKNLASVSPQGLNVKFNLR